MATEEAAEERACCLVFQGGLVDQHHADWPAVLGVDRVAERGRQPRCTESVIARVTKGCAEQCAGPLLGHDEQDSGCGRGSRIGRWHVPQ